jgi:hypothetical protein
MVQDHPRKSRSDKPRSKPVRKKDSLDPKRSSAGDSLESIFSGKKLKWLPLYRRLLARVSRIHGVEAVPSQGAVILCLNGTKSNEMVRIKVTLTGLQCGLALAKAQLKSPRLKSVSSKTRPSQSDMTHQVTISEASDLDEELMTWIKAAAKLRARTSK